MRWILGIPYLACSIYAWGTTIAYFNGLRNSFVLPEPEDADSRGLTTFVALFMAVLGPFGALVTFLLSGFNHYGWTWWRGWNGR